MPRTLRSTRRIQYAYYCKEANLEMMNSIERFMNPSKVLKLASTAAVGRQRAFFVRSAVATI